MSTHAVLIPNAVQAKDIDALNRSAKCSVSNLDNGNVVRLGTGVSSTSGEREVFLAATPNASAPTGLWMVGEPEVVITNAQYKGLDPDPRNFYNTAGDVFTVFKPKKYDIITLTADAFSNSRTTETYVDVASGYHTLAWASSSTSATMFKLLETTTIPISSGAPGSNRVTAYRLECIDE
jgi:hypothetical protein